MKRKNITQQDKLLAYISFVYIGVALVGAAAAISSNMAAEFMGRIPNATVMEDFLLPWGWGTGMSPPAILMIVTLAVGGSLLQGVGPLKAWRWLLTIGGFLFAVGQLGEPHTYKILNGDLFDFPYVLIIPAMVAVPLTMAIVGVRAIIAEARHRA